MKVHQAESDVAEKFNTITDCTFIFPENQVRKFIKKLKLGSAAGLDGITSEHLRMAINSKLPLHLSNLFTICVTFGVVPDAFCHGSLIPILKKSTLNPSDPRSYRPITLSAVLSKILEQFIGVYCVSLGSPAYYCNLDVGVVS